MGLQLLQFKFFKNCIGQKLVKSHLGAEVALVQVRQPAREVPYIAGCIDHPNGNGGDNTWLFFCNYDAFGIIVYYSQLHTYHQIIIGSIQAFGWMLKVMVSHWNFSVGFMYFPSSFQNVNSSFKNYFCDFYLVVGQKMKNLKLIPCVNNLILFILEKNGYRKKIGMRVLPNSKK